MSTSSKPFVSVFGTRPPKELTEAKLLCWLAAVRPVVWAELNDLEEELGPFILVHGGAPGVDRLAAEWATGRLITCECIRPVWKKDGKLDRGAGFARNTDIVRRGDRCVAFWDGRSNGTYDSIEKARDMKKPLIVISIVEALEAAGF